MMEEQFKAKGFCGVDSGMLIIIDPCYILGKDKKKTYDDVMKVVEKSPDKEVIPFEYGVIVHTGLGDGTYDVETIEECGRTREVRIKFFEEGLIKKINEECKKYD